MTAESLARPAGRPFARVVRTLGAILLAFDIFAALMLVRHGGQAKDFGWTPTRKGGIWHVFQVRPGGLAAGRLAPGDRVLAVNGDTRLEQIFGLHLFLIRPGGSYRIRVVRGASELELELAVGVRADAHEAWREASLLAVSLAFGAAGLLVGVRRPGGRSARLFSLSALSTSLVVLASALPSFDLLDHREYALAILTTALNPFHLAVAFHFCSSFPAGSPEGRGAATLRWLFYVAAFLLCAANTGQRLFYLRNPETVISFASAHPALWDARTRVMRVFAPFLVVAMLALLVRNLRLANDPATRRRLRCVFPGLVAGGVPVLAVNVIETLARGAGRGGFVTGDAFALASALANLFQVLIPLAFARVLLSPREEPSKVSPGG